MRFTQICVTLSRTTSFEVFSKTLTWPCAFGSCGPSLPPHSSIRYESCLFCVRRRQSSHETDRLSYWCCSLGRKNEKQVRINGNTNKLKFTTQLFHRLKVKQTLWEVKQRKKVRIRKMHAKWRKKNDKGVVYLLPGSTL